jgi:hypothetical protein
VHGHGREDQPHGAAGHQVRDWTTQLLLDGPLILEWRTEARR